jgi:hypothetical protein
LTPLKY